MSLTGWGLPVLLSVLAAVTLVPLVLGLRPHVQESLAWFGRTLPGFAPGR